MDMKRDAADRRQTVPAARPMVAVRRISTRPPLLRSCASSR